MNFNNSIEEYSGGITAFITSSIIYYDKIVINMMNTGFVLFNTVAAVVISHYLKKFFDKKEDKK